MLEPPAGLGSDGRWLEAASGSAAVGWALIVLVTPNDLLTHAGYVPLGLFVPDWLIGVLMLLGGGAQLHAARRNHVQARAPLAAMVAAGWLLIAYTMAIAAPRLPTWPVMAMLGAWNVGAMLMLIHLSHGARRA